MTTPWLIGHGWHSWIGAIANHLWQSTVFAIAIGLLAVAFRRYQARVRHALWFTASLKFVVPVSLLIGLGAELPQLSAAVRAPAPVISTVVWQISVPFDDSSVVTPSWSASESAPAMGFMTVVFLIWIGGVLAMASMRWRAWRRLNALVDDPTESNGPGLALPAHVAVRWVSGVTEPSVLGFIRPVILLPRGIEA
jgi:bla regulator protein BlaR1